MKKNNVLSEMVKKKHIPCDFLIWLFYIAGLSMSFIFTKENFNNISDTALAILIIIISTILWSSDKKGDKKEIIVWTLMNTIIILPIIPFLNSSLGKDMPFIYLIVIIILSAILSIITKLHKKPAD